MCYENFSILKGIVQSLRKRVKNLSEKGKGACPRLGPPLNHPLTYTAFTVIGGNSQAGGGNYILKPNNKANSECTVCQRRVALL